MISDGDWVHVTSRRGSQFIIARALDGIEGNPDAALAALQAKLKCGTSCGSCAPEIKRMVWGRKGEIGLVA
jgi:hypothetical protein